MTDSENHTTYYISHHPGEHMILLNSHIPQFLVTSLVTQWNVSIELCHLLGLNCMWIHLLTFSNVILWGFKWDLCCHLHPFTCSNSRNWQYFFIYLYLCCTTRIISSISVNKCVEKCKVDDISTFKSINVLISRVQTCLQVIYNSWQKIF